MRFVLVLTVLLALFGLAWAWQQGTLESLRRGVRAEAQDIGGRLDPEFTPLPDGWGVVVVGKPSGADPLPGYASLANRALPSSQGPDAPGTSVEASDAAWNELEKRALGDFRVEVLAGQTLYSIAEIQYGGANEELCTALARYNGLDDPAALETGETLLLPPLERLFEYR